MQDGPLAALPRLSCDGFLFNLCSKLMRMLLWLPWLLLWWFLIQFLFKTFAKCSSGCLASSCGGFSSKSYAKLMQNAPLAALPHLVAVSHSSLIQNRCKMFQWLPCLLLWWFLIECSYKTDAKCSLGCIASSCCDFLLNSYSKLMQNAPLAALSPSVVVSYSMIIRNRCKMHLWLTCLLWWWFLIQFLFKTDAECSSGCLGSSCGGSLFNSYSKIMQNAPLAALAPLVVPHSILIQNWCKMILWLPCLLLWWLLHSILIQNWCEVLLWLPWLLLWWYAKCPLAALATLVVVPHSILIQSWCKMILWLPCLLLWWLLIQFSFKTDAKCSSGCLGSSRGGSSFNPYST